MMRVAVWWGVGLVAVSCAWGGGREVSFCYGPPEWQSVISVPDAAVKSLVNERGKLLYGFGQGSQGFAYQVGVEVATNLVLREQRLHSARVPVVHSLFTNSVLEVEERAFRVIGEQRLPRLEAGALQRVDQGGFSEQHIEGLPKKAAVAEQNNPVHYAVGGERSLIAVALHEGWWRESGKRVVVVRVEGAGEQRVDTVADIGYERTGVLWFEGVDQSGDGVIEVRVEPLSDPQSIVSGIWVFAADDGVERSRELVPEALKGAVSDMGGALPRHTPAADVIYASVRNRSGEEQVVEPAVRVFSRYGVKVESNRIEVESGAVVSSDMRLSGKMRRRRGWHSIVAEPIRVAAGATVNICVVHGDGKSELHGMGIDHVAGRLGEAIEYWEGLELPYGRIVVPDEKVQALIESSIRNMWQMRDIKRGKAVWQTGPTLYRGLWIVDGAFLAEAATVLGCLDEARNAVEYMLEHQQPDGSIQVMKNFWKENGIMLYACYRHARLSQDRGWLEGRWGQLRRIAEHIRVLRQGNRGDPGALDYGMMPAGMPDGGQAAVQAEYSNSLWNLAGLKAFVEAARWLGRSAEADKWQAEYDDFMGQFRLAAKRDARRDQAGNLYLPNYMGSSSREDLPQRALWSFCLAVYPGMVFAAGDELALGTLRMLERCEQQGMVVGTGWHERGIWGYFGSFYAHAWLWMGRGEKAGDLLYAFANHASPVLVWDEEHSLVGDTHKRIGDMPHVWANAEFIRLVVHLLAIERGDELHLLEGLPAEWLVEGARVELNEVATVFGTLSLSVEVKGEIVDVVVDVAQCRGCRGVKVHTEGWRGERRVVERVEGMGSGRR